MTQAADADAFVDSLVGEVTRHPVNSNRFFQTFLSQRLTKSQLQEWLGQYHYFCKQFVKVLEGLLSRTPVDELEMRVQLVKTLHSELGSGRSELEKAGRSLHVAAGPFCGSPAGSSRFLPASQDCGFSTACPPTPPRNP